MQTRRCAPFHTWVQGQIVSGVIRLMDQNVSTDYETKGFIGGKLFNRGLGKLICRNLVSRARSVCHVKNFLIAIDTDDGYCWTYQFRGEHRYVAVWKAGVLATVEHAQCLFIPKQTNIRYLAE